MRFFSSLFSLSVFALVGCTTSEQSIEIPVTVLNQQTCSNIGEKVAAEAKVDVLSASYIADVKDMATVSQLNENQQSAFVPFCKIEGQFEKRIGVNDQQYAIGFGLSFPSNWNGKLLFQGGGGLNGLVREPVGSLAAGNVPAIFRGFAVASTDSGHQNDSIFDTQFFADQQALLNFYWGAVVKTTQRVTGMLETVYQQAPTQRYFVGCSTGGREAMTMSQRYPLLFDGIIAGAPARQTNRSEIADLWSANRLRQVSKVKGEPPFSEAQQSLVVDSLVKQCDAIDGVADNLIFAVEACDFSPASLQCDGANTKACLTQPQVEALVEAFAGPKTAEGVPVYPGFYYDTGIDDNPKFAAPGLLQAEPGPMGRPRLDMPFDIDRELSIATGFPLEPGNAVLNNLSTFAREGHKLLFFHGVSDPWFSAKDTLAYFESLAEKNDNVLELANWSQFYFVPGMGHCWGGDETLDQFDMLSALETWVEQDRQPESVVAWGESMPGVERPLCPYPEVTVYTGSGDTSDAANYACSVVEPLTKE